MPRTSLLNTDSAHGLVLLGLSTFFSFHHCLYSVWSQYEAHDRVNVMNFMRLLIIFFLRLYDFYNVSIGTAEFSKDRKRKSQAGRKRCAKQQHNGPSEGLRRRK